MEKEYKILRYIVKILKAEGINKGGYIMEERNEDLGFNERFLQAIWNEQKIKKSLTLKDERTVKILSPGIWNNGPGPDFRNAEIMLDGSIRYGDIEIHKRSSDWYRHGHDKDARYGNVILHVVWEEDQGGPDVGLPVLELSKCISEDWRRLLWELEESRYAYTDRMHRGGCAIRWAMTEDSKVRKLLEAAGMARFDTKKDYFEEQIELKGEGRALLEAIFDVLGYKKNRVQFRMLAEALDMDLLQSSELSSMDKEALIFGLGNMLPDTTSRQISSEFERYVKDLWDAWWRLGIKPLSGIKWDLSETRPYNRPWRRLAAGIEIMELTNWRPALWLRERAISSKNGRDLLKCMEMLNNKKSRFREYTDFHSKIYPAADLLGKSRIVELASNALLPFLAALGELEGNEHWKELSRKAFMMLPVRQSNRILKEAGARFLTPPSRVKDLVKGTCQQLGMLDIYKNFCLALDNNCELCPFSGGGYGDEVSQTTGGCAPRTPC